MSSDSLDAGIEDFATSFLSRLERLPIAYDSSYNAPCPRGEVRLGAEGKPVVSVVEVTLRQLYGGPASRVVRLAKNEPSLARLLREAAAMLSCAIKDVVLVQDGQVLRESSVARVIAGASSPLYVFNRAVLDGDGGPVRASCRAGSSPAPSAERGAMGFRAELVQLLQRHFDPPQAAALAARFIQEYPGWLADSAGQEKPS